MDQVINFVTFRPNSWKEIEIFLLQTETTYLNTIYKALMAMRPTDTIKILKDVAPANREKFIKIGCLFISEGNSDFEFSDDYTEIKRLQEKPEIKVKEFIQRQKLKKKLKQDELDKAKRANNNAA